MNTQARRVTANLPAKLLEDAMEVTGKGITETLTEGLLALKRRRFGQRALALKGALELDLDLEASRERGR